MRILGYLTSLFLLPALALAQSAGSTRAEYVRLARNIESSIIAECAGSDCNPSVGLFVTTQRVGTITGEPRYRSCSGSLVGPRLFLTNRHCLAIEHVPGAHIAGTLPLRRTSVVVFPAVTGFAEQVVRVTRVMAISPALPSTPISGPDYVTLQLGDDVSRPILNISNAGPRPLQTLTVYSWNRIDTDPARVHARLEPVRATVTASSSVFTLTGHSFMLGNSGSAALSDDGSLLGILQAVGTRSIERPGYFYPEASTIAYATSAHSIADLL